MIFLNPSLHILEELCATNLSESNIPPDKETYQLRLIMPTSKFQMVDILQSQIGLTNGRKNIYTKHVQIYVQVKTPWKS